MQNVIDISLRNWFTHIRMLLYVKRIPSPTIYFTLPPWVSSKEHHESSLLYQIYELIGISSADLGSK